MKRILSNGNDASLQLHPLTFPWAWDIYLKMVDNTWTPREIPMAPDVTTWRRGFLPPNLEHAFLTIFAQLTTFDFQRSVDLSEKLLPFIQAPEVKHALIKQAEQECLHSWSYQFCIENLGLEQEEIYSRWRRVPILKERVDYANAVSEGLDPSNPAKFAADLAFWFLGFEGIWFMLNLRGPIQAMARMGMMTATAEQFQYIAKDEQLHITLGEYIIKEILNEAKVPLIGEFSRTVYEHFNTILELEKRFIAEAFQSSWIGYSPNSHIEMAKYMIDQRLQELGLSLVHNLQQCPLPWVSEMLELKKEKNFFETKVTEYRAGGALSWED